MTSFHTEYSVALRWCFSGVQKLCRRGTWRQGLAGMVGLGWRLDLMIIEVFSNLNDSVILWWRGTGWTHRDAEGQRGMGR